MFLSNIFRLAGPIGKLPFSLTLLILVVIGFPTFSGAQQTCQSNGDVDQNGSVTAADALLAFQQALSLTELSPCQLTIANVFHQSDNLDSAITASDALCIFQKALGLPSCLDNLPPPVERLPFPFILYHDDPEPLRVGVNQGIRGFYDEMPDAQGVIRVALPVVGERGEFEMRYGLLEDGAGATIVEEYLTAGVNTHADGKISRFSVAPAIRIIGPEADEVDIELINRAVRLVNTALPLEWQMRITGRDPNVSFRDVFEWRVRTGKACGLICTTQAPNTIDVEVVPSATFAGTAGIGYGQKFEPAIGRTTDYTVIEKAYIQLNASNYTVQGDGVAVGVVAHEIIHALGLESHVPSTFLSIMRNDYSLSGEFLYAVDREALRARYSRLEIGDSPSDLGEWARTAWHIHGNGEHAAFGVALRNGYAEPYAHGYTPEIDLVDNSALTGVAAWEGILLGFTPDAMSVAGDATLSVTLETLTGSAAFTSLESWSAGKAPGGVGTGETWGDGDLGYSIAVTGNTFKQTGGDAGILTGAFFGSGHEGMGGTLERDDLTAAFGGKR